MRYAITHLTRFDYDSPVSESHMEVRMQPRTGERQTCLRYLLDVEPRARPHAFRDHLSNWVDYFSVPSRHQSLSITARADVQVEPPAELPQSLDTGAWREVDEWSRHDAHWDLRQPSSFAVWSAGADRLCGLDRCGARAIDRSAVDGAGHHVRSPSGFPI